MKTNLYTSLTKKANPQNIAISIIAIFIGYETYKVSDPLAEQLGRNTFFVGSIVAYLFFQVYRILLGVGLFKTKTRWEKYMIEAIQIFFLLLPFLYFLKTEGEDPTDWHSYIKLKAVTGIVVIGVIHFLIDKLTEFCRECRAKQIRKNRRASKTSHKAT